jgi:amidase
MATNWEAEAKKAQEILAHSIPKQWLAPSDKFPPADQLNVEGFPRKSGILSEEDLAITDMSATALVEKMGRGELTAESVVTAFLRRAVLGHQLVCNTDKEHQELQHKARADFCPVELCNRIHGR